MAEKQALILCSGNSARRQMAEGLLRYDAGDRLQVFSAGIEPIPIRPEAIAVMREIGIDLSGPVRFPGVRDEIREYLHTFPDPDDEWRSRSLLFPMSPCSPATPAKPKFPSRSCTQRLQCNRFSANSRWPATAISITDAGPRASNTCWLRSGQGSTTGTIRRLDGDHKDRSQAGPRG
jgi:Low molecular weight phosphotyrosine protein phosphatase